jgi:predicted Zn-ribbon and HTH transcriptional regulator
MTAQLSPNHRTIPNMGHKIVEDGCCQHCGTSWDDHQQQPARCPDRKCPTGHQNGYWREIRPGRLYWHCRVCRTDTI